MDAYNQPQNKIVGKRNWEIDAYEDEIKELKAKCLLMAHWISDMIEFEEFDEDCEDDCAVIAARLILKGGKNGENRT